MWFMEEPSQLSVGQTAQSLTCSSWKNHMQGWMTVWICYCHALEKGDLFFACGMMLIICVPLVTTAKECESRPLRDSIHDVRMEGGGGALDQVIPHICGHVDKQHRLWGLSGGSKVQKYIVNVILYGCPLSREIVAFRTRWRTLHLLERHKFMSPSLDPSRHFISRNKSHSSALKSLFWRRH